MMIGIVRDIFGVSPAFAIKNSVFFFVLLFCYAELLFAFRAGDARTQHIVSNSVRCERDDNSFAVCVPNMMDR